MAETQEWTTNNTIRLIGGLLAMLLFEIVMWSIHPGWAFGGPVLLFILINILMFIGAMSLVFINKLALLADVQPPAIADIPKNIRDDLYRCPIFCDYIFAKIFQGGYKGFFILWLGNIRKENIE